MEKTPVDLIKEVETLVKEGWIQKDNPEELSKTLYDISAINWKLGTHLGEYEEQERAMKAELDLDKAKSINELVDQDMSVNKAEIKTTLVLAEKRKMYNRTASDLEKVKIIIKANEKVMDAIRSRLSLIKQDIQK